MIVNSGPDKKSVPDHYFIIIITYSNIFIRIMLDMLMYVFTFLVR